ncbi:MAG: hypothetical protein V1934_08085 [Methanobacteriota archaeon]
MLEKESFEIKKWFNQSIFKKAVCMLVVMIVVALGFSWFFYEGVTKKNSSFETIFRFEGQNQTSPHNTVVCFFSCDGPLCAQRPFYLDKFELYVSEPENEQLENFMFYLYMPNGRGSVDGDPYHYLNYEYEFKAPQSPPNGWQFPTTSHPNTSFSFYFEGIYLLEGGLHLNFNQSSFFDRNLSVNSTPLQVESYQVYNNYISTRITMASLIFGTIFVTIPSTFVALAKLYGDDLRKK